MDELAGLLGLGGMAASAYLPYAAAGGQIDYLRGLGPQLAEQATQIGQTAAERAQFTPFTVTTGTGSTAVGPGGGLTQTLGQTPAEIQQGLLLQALTTSQQATPTAQSLFEQMQALQAPEIERRRQQLATQQFGQGRTGVQTAAYGGTPEALAFEKALQEQQSQNMLTALTQAPALAGQQIQNIGGLLGAAYTPETQALAALTPAAQFANIAQSAGLGEAESLYKGGIAGLEAQAGAGTAVSSLEANRVRALADALSGLFSAQSGQASPYMQLIDVLGLTGSEAT
jgi:hypothetical protein